MLKEKIVESIDKKASKDLPFWYKERVLKLSGLLLKKVKEENVPIKSNNTFESRKLEVILK